MSESFICFQPRPTAKYRLFCFPYAGGSAQVFRPYAEALPTEIELHALELPGRGRRFREQPFSSLSALIETLISQFLDYTEKPFIFWGHSLGGLIAFELACSLQALYQLSPERLYLSASRAPHLNSTEPPKHLMTDPELIEELARFQGTPQAILDNAEIMALLLPTLRADFSMIETYQYRGQRLACPIRTISSLEDEVTFAEDVKAWEQQSLASTEHHTVAGDHFFLHQPGFPQILVNQLKADF